MKIKSKHEGISNSEKIRHAKKLHKHFIKNYSMLSISICVLELLIIGLMQLVNYDVARKVGIGFSAVNLTATFIYFGFFDYGVIRTLKKQKTDVKISNNQSEVFVLFLRMRMMSRLLLNLLLTTLTICLTIFVFVI